MGSIFLLLLPFLLSLNGHSVNCERPRAVNIGAVLTFDSVIGAVAKVAIETAVDDINANPKILGGTRLNLVMENSNCNAFLGSIGALRLLEKDAVAIIGPQSSTVAHTISFVANGLQIPLVSFAATDPTLSSLQFPYFFRTTQSDFYQMAAMADVIDYYGWKEVITVFVDDDYGWNGVSTLGDALAKKLSKIVYKVALPVGASYSTISESLNRSKLIGPRVYVVHANPDSGLLIFSIAQHLQMMTDEYVWLATDSLSTSLDSTETPGNNLLNLQGVISFRQYIPDSGPRKAFVSRWNELRKKGRVSYRLNTYGFYAYDTVWAVAHAINKLLNDSDNITFSPNNNLQDVKGKLQLGKLKTFDNGQLLLQKLLLSNFTGISGPIQFDIDRNLIRGVYEVINIGHSVIHSIGYWSTHSGLSVSVPSVLNTNVPRNFSENQSLHGSIWPGGRSLKPRGYVLASRERPLKIGVPYRASYVEFVTETGETHEVKGYSIDVFKAALALVPYDIPYQFVPFGDGHSNPSYDQLVYNVANNVFDAAVGDIAIVTNRTRLVDFTQPYIATGLVIIAPIGNKKSSTWVFLRPFTGRMWCVTGAFFVMIGFVIWVLEHRVNKDFRGPPKRQCVTMLLFSFSTLFNSQQEDTVSTLGRMVMMVWLFLLMVITSSYTASLTSFLTVQQLSSPIKGIDSLIATNQPIGYQIGSFARSYLIDSLNIRQSRLVSLGSPEAYEAALQLGPKNGGVAAIVDELPYVELFLAKTSGFGIVGKMFTKSGWGFAFPRDYPLAVDLSTAILRLSENGQLQRIHDKWLCKESCIKHGDSDSGPNQLHITSFWGLFLVCGLVTITALIIFLLKTIQQFVRFKRKHRDPSSTNQYSSERGSGVINNFFKFIDEKEEAIKNMFRQHESSSDPQVS
uniref:Glutamate receptor n=1 Tax=Anthurium amnicola TaxID=1678845 RepID=A0A1D1Z9P6_9ARAE